MALTKAEILKAIVEKAGFQRNKAIDTCETLIEIIKESLASGEDVLVSRFGKFCVRDKGARKGRNPATGEDIILGPRRVVRFKSSDSLRDKINGK